MRDPDDGDACGRCGGQLIQRVDDSEAVVRERLKVYHRATEPLVDFYRGRPTFRMVNGAQAPDAVARELDATDRRCGRREGTRTMGAQRSAGPMIVCRSKSEIEKLRRVNQLVATILAELRQMVVPGVTTQEIDALAEAQVRAAGAEPAFKGYHGYPATVCASVNEQVVHGIPSSRKLVEGDVLSIDMGAKLDGFFGDCAVTVPVGRGAADAEQLLRVTEEALFLGIDAVKPGARVSDIGAAVQAHVEANGFSVVREFVGHGIGTSLHEEPQIANYGPAGRGRGWPRAWCWRSSRW